MWKVALITTDLRWSLGSKKTKRHRSDTTMDEFNEQPDDRKERLLSAGLLVSTVLLNFGIRYIASLVIEADLQKNLLTKKGDANYTALVGEHRWLSLLGVPHVVRSRTKIGFTAILLAALATSFGGLAIGAVKRSSKLKTGKPVGVITFAGGPPVLDEDKLWDAASRMRGTGVVSICSRRDGANRKYYQPYVETTFESRVYCGELMHSNLRFETDGFLEDQAPDEVVVTDMKGVATVTEYSRYQRHKAVVRRIELKAVCNSGMFYRGVRSGLVSQSCAFATGRMLVLGGYISEDGTLDGPGIEPNKTNMKYYDSYTVELGTRLNDGQLLQAVTLWDLGIMSEIEVAALARVAPASDGQKEVFAGGQVGLAFNIIELLLGLATIFIVGLLGLSFLAYDSFSRRPGDRLSGDVSTLEAVSKIMRVEAEAQTGRGMNDQRGNTTALNEIAIRCTGTNADGKSVFHLGSEVLGEAKEATNKKMLETLW
eukprot:Plantae.Rhodophyta-Hildenbrandia_rubra.ctg11478.p1 GENE.Plantae.Rhodophyta-Hildenbrandia_rubra.ctg11478~~Plantae.Rhodophyta-Hildenbrandia_rubra.ctg11478.p1  ORF type:complete len:484 (+),score=55.03 Plantae.Rhodophyta-Hildenbrandia_rubra.ctg11478:1330-2781(+)